MLLLSIFCISSFILTFLIIKHQNISEEIKQSNRITRDRSKAQVIHNFKLKEISSKYKLESVGAQITVDRTQINALRLIDYKYEVDIKYMVESQKIKDKMSLDHIKKTKEKLISLGMQPMTKGDFDKLINSKNNEEGPLYDECPIHKLDEDYDENCKTCNIEINEDGSPKNE